MKRQKMSNIFGILAAFIWIYLGATKMFQSSAANIAMLVLGIVGGLLNLHLFIKSK